MELLDLLTQMPHILFTASDEWMNMDFLTAFGNLEGECKNLLHS